jgi:hypothetical protein
MKCFERPRRFAGIILSTAVMAQVKRPPPAIKSRQVQMDLSDFFKAIRCGKSNRRP